jgi:hypothetical protein
LGYSPENRSPYRDVTDGLAVYFIGVIVEHCHIGVFAYLKGANKMVKM